MARRTTRETTVTKRELNQHTARVLGDVAPGQSVVVTERGVPRWRIESVGSEDDPIARLRAQGRIHPANPNPAPWPHLDNPSGRTPDEVDALINEMRGDH